MARYYKHSIFCFFILLFFYSSLVSCQEGGDAGDLLGQWRLEESVATLENSSVSPVHYYLSFSGSVTRFRTDGGSSVFGNFQHVGDSVFIQCYSVHGNRSDTTLVENRYGFKPFNDIRLKIESLDSDHLVLSKDGTLWNFDKY